MKTVEFVFSLPILRRGGADLRRAAVGVTSSCCRWRFVLEMMIVTGMALLVSSLNTVLRDIEQGIGIVIRDDVLPDRRCSIRCRALAPRRSTSSRTTRWSGSCELQPRRLVPGVLDRLAPGDLLRDRRGRDSRRSGSRSSRGSSAPCSRSCSAVVAAGRDRRQRRRHQVRDQPPPPDRSQGPVDARVRGRRPARASTGRFATSRFSRRARASRSASSGATAAARARCCAWSPA